MKRKVHIGDRASDICGAFCGRGSSRCDRDEVVNEEEFAGWSPRSDRCAYCEQDQYPHGQPDWHWQFNYDRNQER